LRGRQVEERRNRKGGQKETLCVERSSFGLVEKKEGGHLALKWKRKETTFLDGKKRAPFRKSSKRCAEERRREIQKSSFGRKRDRTFPFSRGGPRGKELLGKGMGETRRTAKGRETERLEGHSRKSWGELLRKRKQVRVR